MQPNPISQRKPNVVVFFTDQQRWDTSSLHGNPLDLMPNFARMARRGTHVEYAFTCQPVCAPARSSLQTGMYPTQTGVFKNHLPLTDKHPTLAQYFNEAGYTTGYIGKWHLGGTAVSFNQADQEPVPSERRGGYTHWLAADLPEFLSDAYNAVLFDNDNHPVALPGYRADAITDAGIRFIDAHKAQPFFLFLSFLEPHHQNTSDSYPAPAGYEERYRGTWMPPDLAALPGSAQKHLWGYYGMVRRLDECLGRVLDVLQSLQLDNDTIVVFTSDHGNHFKTRNDEYKRSCHESSIRIPMAIQGRMFDGGGRIQSLASLVDLPPTLLEAAGITQTVPMAGTSLLGRLHGKPTEREQDIFIQISESQTGRALRTRRWKYSVSAPGVDGNSSPDSPWYQEEFLYDLEHDPYELENLVGVPEYAQVSAALRERLVQRISEVEGCSAQIITSNERPAMPQRIQTARNW